MRFCLAKGEHSTCSKNEQSLYSGGAHQGVTMTTLAIADKKIERLIKQLAQAEAAKQLAQARDKKKERSRDTRRKILIGAMMLAEMKKSEMTTQAVTKKLEKYLTKDTDRALFGLEPVEPDTDKPVIETPEPAQQSFIQRCREHQRQ